MTRRTPEIADNVRAHAILDATLRLIGERGLEAVTHRSAADAAGVSAGAVAHHFGTRDLLVQAALMRAARIEIDRIERVTLEAAGRMDDLESCVEALAAGLGGDHVSRLASCEFLLASARQPKLRVLMRDWNAAHLRLAEIVLKARHSADPSKHAAMTVSLLTGFMVKQLAYPAVRFEEEVLKPTIREWLERIAPLSGKQKRSR